MYWSIEVIEPAKAIIERAVAFIPTLIAAIIVLLLGWIVAKIVERLVIKLLRVIQVDRLSEKTGVARFLKKGEIKYTLSELIGILVYWLIMLAIIMAAANVLQLEVAATLLNNFILFVPSVIASVFVLVLGIFFANLIGAIVRSTAVNAGIAEGHALGKIAQMIVIAFSVITALYQLGIATGILLVTVQIVLGAIGLGLALAFGMGCKDMAAGWMNDFVEKLKKK